jgi:hypothetical protein
MKPIVRAARIVVLFLFIGGMSLAQEPPPAQAPAAGPIDEELGQAIRQHFLTRLRAELALTDEQMAAVTPLVEELEEVRSRLRRDKIDTVRALNHGMEEGAGDAELQGLLDRLDAIEQERRAAEASVMARVDEQLTVRQRVQFRFYTERFRRNLERRIEDIRRDRHRSGNRRGAVPRVPPGQRP